MSQNNNEKLNPPKSNTRQLLFLLARYSKPYRKSIFLLLVGTILATFLTALHPLFLAPILDIALGKFGVESSKAVQLKGLQNFSLNNLGAYIISWLRGLGFVFNPLIMMLLMSVVFILVAAIANAIIFSNYLLALWIRVRAGRAMQLDLMQHLLTHSLDFFSKSRTGDLISRLSTDTSASISQLEYIIQQVVTFPLLIAFYGFLLFITSPMLSMGVLVAAFLHIFLTKTISNPIRKRSVAKFDAFAQFTSTLQEILLSIRVVKSFVAEKFEIENLKRDVSDIVNVNMKFGVYKHIEKPVRDTVNTFITGVIAILAAREAFYGNITATGFFMFIYIGKSIIAPIAGLGDTYTIIQTTLAAAKRIFEIFEQKPTIQDGKESIKDFQEAIILHNVGFCYDSKWALEKINLEIKKGEMVAFVGPSGGGKSTITDLILRFYDPCEGNITIDGKDLRSLNVADLRRLFGIVSQECLLFNATIRENIAYGRPEMSDEDIVHSAKIANIHNFIMDLPHGYGTFVGDRGILISGGQRQRIAIARAVAGKPQILIMDEATSSLDSESEKQVQEAIDRVIQKMTAIVIAHRLSTILHSDKIVVLNNGRIEAIGNHGILLQTSPIYERLYQLQFNDGNFVSSTLT